MFHYIIGPGIREHENFYLERRTFALFSKKKKKERRKNSNSNSEKVECEGKINARVSEEEHVTHVSLCTALCQQPYMSTSVSKGKGWVQSVQAQKA